MAHLRVDWDDIDKEKFAETLKRYRLYRGYTQAKLAEKLGVKNTTISNYEKGVSLPDLNTILNIARILKVDPGEFYVDWRFGSPKPFEDIAPTTVQVERDLVEKTLTRWFVSLPGGRNFRHCRAWAVPKKYLMEDDDKIHFVVIMPAEQYFEGDVIVGIADENAAHMGVYGYDESGNELLKPIKRWNPDYRTGVIINKCASFEIIGKVILYNTVEIPDDL